MRLRHSLLMATMLTFTAPAFAEEYVIMKLNGQDVSSSEVQHMWEGLFPAGQAPAFDTVKPDVRERILRAVMAEKLLYGEAIKAGTDKTPKLLAELEEVKRKLIVRSFLDGKTSDTITDADVKREYDAMIGTLRDEKEVRARHILVATEQEAKDAKKKLDSGKSFEEVAREMSKDPGSAPKGGDLGYFTKDRMVKEFSTAAFSMKKGEVSGPVKSSFGYHIIKVEDSRKVTTPTFNEVKDQLKAKLQEKKLNDYIGSLVKGADVKTFDAKGKEVSFAKDPADAAKAEAKAEKPAEEKKADKPVEEKKVEEKKADAKKEEKKEEKKEDKKADEKKADEKKPAEKADKSEKSDKADKPN